MSHQYDWNFPEIGWGNGIPHIFRIYKDKKLLRKETNELSDLIENIAKEENIYDYLDEYFDYGEFFKKGYEIEVSREKTYYPILTIKGDVLKEQTNE